MSVSQKRSLILTKTRKYQGDQLTQMLLGFRKRSWMPQRKRVSPLLVETVKDQRMRSMRWEWSLRNWMVKHPKLKLRKLKLRMARRDPPTVQDADAPGMDLAGEGPQVEDAAVG